MSSAEIPAANSRCEHVAINVVMESAKSGEEDSMKQPASAVFPKNKKGDTALHLAAKAGDVSEVTALLKQHQDYKETMLWQKNGRGNTALHEALIFNDKDSVANALIEQAEDPKLSYLQNNKKESALCLAAKSGFVRCVSLILRTHTGVLDDSKERNPLHHAASLGYDKVASKLLHKCSSYATQRDENGSLPIHLASIEGHVKVVKLLLNDTDSKQLLDRNGRNILHLAAENGRDNVVKFLLKKKSFDQDFINMEDKDGNTALHLATKNWKPMIVSTLTWDKRVDIKALNDKEETALDVAETNMPSECTNNQWLTRAALKAARTPRYQSSTAIEKRDTRKLTFYKEKATFRLNLSILVATVAFAAGFSLPNGHKYLESDTHSTSGIELILKRIALKIFIVSNIMSMYSSISSAVVLSWAQSGDLNLVNNALNFTLPLFWIALSMMSMTFMAGVYLVIKEHVWLHIASLVMGVAFHSVLLFHCLVVFNPIASSNRVLRYLTYYPFRFLVLVNSSWPRLRDFTWSNKH